MKYRVLWGFGPAPGRVSDRKGLSRAGGLSGRTMRRRSNGNRGCVPNVPQTCGNVSQTCRVRIGREHVLNSSHLGISYAVFCLKKKKKLPSGYSFVWSGQYEAMQRAKEKL